MLLLKTEVFAKEASSEMSADHPFIGVDWHTELTLLCDTLDEVLSFIEAMEIVIFALNLLLLLQFRTF